MGLFPWFIDATTTTTFGLIWRWLFTYTDLELCYEDSKNVYYFIYKIIMWYCLYTEQIWNVAGHAFQFWLFMYAGLFKWNMFTVLLEVFTWLWVCDTPAVVHELVCQWNACISTHGYCFWELVPQHWHHSHLYCIK